MKQVADLRTKLLEKGILTEAKPTERCIIVVPSARIKSGRFAVLLRDNGIGCRALGHGEGSVRDGIGRKSRVRGLLVIAVDHAEVVQVERYARLFGVTAIVVDEEAPEAVGR